MSVEGYLALSPLKVSADAARETPRLFGLVLPHAGHRYSGKTCGAAVAAVRHQKISTILMLGPAHSVFIRNAVMPDVTHFETPLGAVPVDLDRTSRLAAAGISVSNAPHAREHCLEILLPFFQASLKEFKIVPILLGVTDLAGLDALAGHIRPMLDDRTLVVASSDFVHYGDAFDYTPDVGPDVQAGIRRIDEGAIDRIKSRDAPGLLAYRQKTGATICGIFPIALALRLAPEHSRIDLVSYSQSADVGGDLDRVVSYASIAIYHESARAARLGPQDQDELVALACNAVRETVSCRRRLDIQPPKSTALMTNAAAFVTLTKSGDLRGCIGTLNADKPLWQAVRDAAYSAACEDHRFPPVRMEELPDISVEVTVLSPTREIPSDKDFIPGRHGIVIEKDGKRAVFLPQVAEEMRWTAEQTLDALCRKAGLAAGAWRQPDARFWIFFGEKYGEKTLPLERKI